MKTFLTSIFLLLSTLSFSQTFKVKNEYILMSNDTIGKITDISCETCKPGDNPLSNLDSASFLNRLTVDILLNRYLSDDEKNKIDKFIFNSNCKLNFVDGFEKPNFDFKIDQLLYTESINQQFQMTDIQKRLDQSSNYLIKSSEQKNTALIIGVAGSLISTLILTSDVKKKGEVAAGMMIMTAGAVVVLEISANNNQKKAGLALRFK